MEVLALELERLDALMVKPYQAALEGDMTALSAVLAIMNRCDRYLGLDAPMRTATAVLDHRTPKLLVETVITLPEFESAAKQLLEKY